ncbi:MAG: hypothetical protein JST22_20110 [Bacteroidetes bacterium]|nr:hypothetical protein [Bacteroidota bacterium]
MQAGNSIVLIAAFAGILGLAGCSRSHTGSYPEYMRWLGDPAHGLVQTHVVRGLRISLTYLPSDFRTYQEVRNDGEHAGGGAENQSANTVAVLLSISRDTASAGHTTSDDPSAIMQEGVALNEQLKEHLELRADGCTYRPVVTALDNDAGMSGHINITAIYVDESDPHRLVKARNLDVAFDDPLFGCGISHFQFRGEDIDRRLHLDI